MARRAVAFVLVLERGETALLLRAQARATCEERVVLSRVRTELVVASPYARRGTVDHTQYDTASALRLITHVFGLPTLPGLAARDTALQSNGFPAMGDLTAALDLRPDAIFGNGFE